MYGLFGIIFFYYFYYNDIYEFQEISENSESEIDGYISFGNSWKECRMIVFINFDSECSIISDVRISDRDMLYFSIEYYSLSDGLIIGIQFLISQEYIYSYLGKFSRSVRSVGFDYFEYEEYNFSR